MCGNGCTTLRYNSTDGDRRRNYPATGQASRCCAPVQHAMSGPALPARESGPMAERTDPFNKVLCAARIIQEAENRHLRNGIHTLPIDRVDRRFNPLSLRYNMRGWMEHKRALRLLRLQRCLDAARPAFVEMGYTGKEFDEYRGNLLGAANGLTHWNVGLEGGKPATLER